jgi:hypothetical protein
MSIAIPQSLLGAMTASFETEGKRIAKEVAKILRVPEKDVLQLVKQIPKVQFKVHNDSEAMLSCPILIEEPGLVKRCRHPCILGTSRCIHHQSNEVLTVPDSVKSLTRIKGHPYWCDEETREVYAASGERIGILNDDNQLELYTYDTA